MHESYLLSFTPVFFSRLKLFNYRIIFKIYTNKYFFTNMLFNLYSMCDL